MNNFKIIKKGYSQLEVDSYIEKLKEDYEARLAEQKDRIFYLKDQLDKITNSSDNELVTSLVGAVERARMIETSSKNIYELETKKLSLLYTKMEKLLTDENIRNDRSVKQELLELIQDCRSSLESNIIAQSENVRETTSGDPVKTLLSKMIDFNKTTVDYNLIKREAKIIEENNKKTIKIIPTNEVIRKEVPSSVKVVQVRHQVSSERQAQNVLTNSETANEFDKFLSENNNINGANFESIMFSKSQTSASKLKASSLSRYSSRRERIQQSRQKAQEKASSLKMAQSENSKRTEVSSKSKEKLSSSTEGRLTSATKSTANSQSLVSAKETKSSSSNLPKYSYNSTTGLNYSGYSSGTYAKSSATSKAEKNSSSKIQESGIKETDSFSSKSVKASKETVKEDSKLNINESSSNKVSQKASSNSKNVETINDSNEMEISTKSKNAVSNKKVDKGYISVETKSKSENTANGKTESKQVSVSGTSGNTNFSATASYKSSYSSTSSNSSSNPNDELSDEEFLRAYLGDLEYEEQERQKTASTSNSSYSKITQTTITSSSSSSSKRSSSNAYVTGGRMGDYSPNETGFNLKEAINPKEDLDEIMKAFDFFNDNKKKK